MKLRKNVKKRTLQKNGIMASMESKKKLKNGKNI